jgi:aspartyl-tRNA(Asn)/glutamyl-tRNA(Gln) amidotransferase subunit C
MEKTPRPGSLSRKLNANAATIRDPRRPARRIQRMAGGWGFLDSPVVADPISRADVEHVAKLARLALTDAEIEDLTAELGSILGHAGDIEALALDDVPPTAHPLPLENVLRADDVRPTLDRDEVLAQAPAAEAGRFRVPRILGEAP